MLNQTSLMSFFIKAVVLFGLNFVTKLTKAFFCIQRLMQTNKFALFSELGISLDYKII